jgi:hypothetical protein
MTAWLIAIWNFIVQTLLAELIVVIFGVFIVQKGLELFDKWRYDGWHVIVWQDGKQILKREISYKKLKAIQEEPADLSVYLKGVASPYTWFQHVDLIEDGESLGLISIDAEEKTYTLNLDKNPSKD